jgi:hypothetical protein
MHITYVYIDIFLYVHERYLFVITYKNNICVHTRDKM